MSEFTYELLLHSAFVALAALIVAVLAYRLASRTAKIVHCFDVQPDSPRRLAGPNQQSIEQLENTIARLEAELTRVGERDYGLHQRVANIEGRLHS